MDNLSPPIRVAMLAIPGVQMLDLAGPMDVFHEAGVALGRPMAYDVKIVAMSLDQVKALNGTRFTPDMTIDEGLEGFDTLLVAGSPGIKDYERHPQLTGWLSHEAGHVRRYGSICTGAFLLAHAGLLDGRRATTHWNSVQRLADTFPDVRVEPNSIYVKDGPIYTSAGVSSAMDLALGLVEEDFGRSVALRVAKELILFLKRPGGQSQFSMQLAAQASDVGAVRDIHQWILGNLAGDLSVDTMAAHLNMSSRNFQRQFKRETDQTPADYVEAARVEEARRILEESDTPLKKVAGLCGFSNQGGLRRAFMRRINVTPVEYRQRFRSTETPIHRSGCAGR